jgi:hypothetical protein
MFTRTARGGGHFGEFDLKFAVRALAEAFTDIAAADIPEPAYVSQLLLGDRRQGLG